MNLHERKKQLEDQIYGLECSDDSLYSNANGNYPLYKSLRKELSEINEKLKD